MRIDKMFSEIGMFTRRETADRIRRKLITVNGVTVKKPDEKVNPEKDEIRLNGEVVKYKKYAYILVNKPNGVVSATEDGRDKTVVDLLPPEMKKLGLFPCGRLDKDTVGLVILTNDGVSAHNNLSPKRHVEKKYYFETADEYFDEDITAIENGLTLADGYTTKPCKIEREGKNSGYITLTEGKYHEIKRLFGARKNKITYLKRISFSKITLGDLKEGDWRYLTDDEEFIFTNK
ncbi:MAG: 16S rRNA pseudouridine(516) synthase [Clostridia bacterium]|nr:16S rRNA pseudouridine(516) synthase [Clostridia bacterium]